MSAPVLERPVPRPPEVPRRPQPPAARPGRGGGGPAPPGMGGGGGGGGGGGRGPGRWPMSLAIVVVAAIGALFTAVGVLMHILATVAGSQLLPGA